MFHVNELLQARFTTYVTGSLAGNSFVSYVIVHQFRRHGEFLGAWPPQAELQAPLNWNTKHYEKIEILLNFRVSIPPTQTQSPAETQSSPIENFLATVLLHTLYLFCLVVTTVIFFVKWAAGAGIFQFDSLCW